jgi:KDO2-lipid IV(A) lauroyltransferase
VLSNLLFLLFCTILPYRKKVIDSNLALAFPNKSSKEKLQIRKDFYRYFSDLLVESIKNLSISQKQLLGRMQLENPEILEEIKALNKPILLVAGHYNNWELTTRRERFGLKVVHAQNYPTAFAARNPVVLVLADQAPNSANQCLWLPFLGRETAVIFGPEYMANQFNCAVVFASISNSKRGYYNVQLKVLADNSKTLSYQEITKLHVKKLEQQILDNPARWLWTHKRWKHQKSSNWHLTSQELEKKFESKFRSHDED